MRLCWVTNEKRYSRLYRYLFDEPASHVGVLFGFDKVTLAVDLNRPFGRVWDSRHWFSKYSLVWSMDIAFEKRDELDLYRACSDYAVLRAYDMPGYYYGMVAGVKRKMLGVPLPDSNKWSRNTGSMCQEIVTPIVQHPAFQKVVPNSLDPTVLSARTTNQVMLMMGQITAGNPAVSWVYHG